MVEMKEILCLTDFTPEATQALAYARALTERFGAGLRLLHVIENPTSKSYGEVAGDFLAQEMNARTKTQEWLAKIKDEQLSGLPKCETMMGAGDLFEQVLKVVAEKKIDVLVMSAHTHRGFHLHLLTNLPGKLVHDAPCHVFVVHSAGK